MKSVLFVCVGNICRSPAAQAILAQFAQQEGKDIYISSRAIGSYNLGQPTNPKMREALKKRGLDITHIAKLITAKDFEEFDYILASDQGVLIDLQNMCPRKSLLKKLHKMTDFGTEFKSQDVPDPYLGPQKGFELVLDMLEDACLGLLQEITQKHKN